MITISGDTLTMTEERFKELLRDGGSNMWKLFQHGRIVTMWNKETFQVYQGVYGLNTDIIKLKEIVG